MKVEKPLSKFGLAVLALLFLAIDGIAGSATSLQSRIRDLLPASPKVDPISADDVLRIESSVLARPDPETFFSRYIFGLKRHAAKLLTPQQAKQLETIIAERSSIGQRWHDERNTLRCKFNEVMWHYAAAPEAKVTSLRVELEGWMKLRMEWTLREHMAAHDFNLAVWKLLAAEQQKHLLAGDWKRYAKLDTGHTRGNATGKVITRALGKPDHADAFAKALAAWEQEREPLHHKLQSAEDTARRAGFAMDINSPALVRVLTDRANAAYATIYLAEAEAMRRLVRAGYDNPVSRCDQAALDAWGEATSRFEAGAAKLITLLSNGSRP